MAKSTRKKTANPEKPYDGFPLFAHATNRWAKKIRGKRHDFGPWDEPEAAMGRFNHEWPYLSQGRRPPPLDTDEGCTVHELADAFLVSKRNKLESGELSQQSFADYYNTCGRLIDRFGRKRLVEDLRPDVRRCPLTRRLF